MTNLPDSHAALKAKAETATLQDFRNWANALPNNAQFAKANPAKCPFAMFFQWFMGDATLQFGSDSLHYGRENNYEQIAEFPWAKGIFVAWSYSLIGKKEIIAGIDKPRLW